MNDTSLLSDKDIPVEDRLIFALDYPSPEAAMEIVVPQTAVTGRYDNKQNWLRAVTAAIPKLVEKNRGRTLVLFSSYSDLAAVAGEVSDTLVGMNLPLLVQQKGLSTVNLCEEFRSVKESVLFGWTPSGTVSISRATPSPR